MRRLLVESEMPVDSVRMNGFSHKRLAYAFVLLALLVSACGGGAEPAASADPESVDSPAAVESTTGDPAVEPSEPVTPAETPAETPASEQTEEEDAADELPMAPDFDLVLGDGSTFTLSAVDKPVYLVFWAEW